MPPFNGSGTYSPPGASFPAVANTLIESAKFNAVINDIATALSTCITKDGQTTVTANIPMAGFRFTGLGSGVAASDSATLAQAQGGVASTLTSVAGTNTITATATPTPVYAVGQKFTFVPAVTNTGAVTLNISSVGAGAVRWAGAALTGGELVAGTPVTVLVTAATPVFEIINQTQFPDSRALVVGATDATKKLRFEVDGFTTATTRVLTPPNYDGTIATLAGSEALTNKTLTSPVINTAVTGTAIASQAQQEAGTAVDVLVTPGQQKYHPLHPKGWAYLQNGSGVVASSGLTSVTANAAGDITFNWNFSFSSVNYCAIVSTGQQGRTCVVSARTVNTTRVLTANTADVLEDNDINIVVFGDV